MNISRGFTIVELMIVVVVIGILAAITVVAYNGATTCADTQARLAEMKGYEKLYKLYFTTFGHWPQLPEGPQGGNNEGYCLGTGFPDSDGTGRGNCRDFNGVPPWQSHGNSVLMTELAKVGRVTQGPRDSPGSGSLGPFALWYPGENIVIFQVFKGTSCPDGTATAWQYPDNQAIICTIHVDDGGN